MSEFWYKGKCVNCKKVSDFIGGATKASCNNCHKDMPTDSLELTYSQDDYENWAEMQGYRGEEE